MHTDQNQNKRNISKIPGTDNFATCINLNGSSYKNSSKRQELYRNVGNIKNKIINTTLLHRNSKVEQVNCKKQNITSDEVNIRNASDGVKRKATIPDADEGNCFVIKLMNLLSFFINLQLFFLRENFVNIICLRYL